MGRRESRREGGEENVGWREEGKGRERRQKCISNSLPPLSQQLLFTEQTSASALAVTLPVGLCCPDVEWGHIGGGQKPVLFTYQTAADTCCGKRRQGSRAPLKVPGGCLRSPCCSPYKVRDLEGHPHSRDSFRNVHRTLLDRPGW